MKVGIVVNEFFAPGVSRLGGFGWAAREATRALLTLPGAEVVLLTGEFHEDRVGREPNFDGVPLVPLRSNPLAHLRAVRRERPDLLLAVDFRANYRRVLYALPRTPLVVWSRNPRPPAIEATLRTLRVPGRPGVVPAGVAPVGATSMRTIVRHARLVRRPLRIATVAPGELGPRIPGAFGLDGIDVELLPNPLPHLDPTPKAPQPTVVFLARLDPYKRPWLVVELARRMPDVRFVMAGEPYVAAERGWAPPADPPPNLELTGMLHGDAKRHALGSAWALVNTSIHEGLPITFLEALALGTPIVSCRDPDGVVSRFGRDVGRFDGTGEHGLHAFERGLRDLLADTATRERTAREAPGWVAERHTPERFLAAFERLARGMGVAP